MENINGHVCISRPTSNVEDDHIQISVRDENSRLNFLRIKLSLADFAKCVTGVEMPVTMTTDRLEFVGKHKITKADIIQLPLGVSHYSTSRQAIKKWLEQNAQQEGWQLDSYIGSQNSIFTNKEGITCANVKYFKYIDDESE